MSKEIANAIYAQLGGGRFAMMTGAHSFTFDGPNLIFRLRRNDRNISAMRITLTPADLYKVEALRIRSSTVTVVATQDDIWCDGLQAAFTEMTGLATRLGRILVQREA